MFFFHHPETPQAIKLKRSDFKDIFDTHFTCYTSSLYSEVLPWQQNYKRYLVKGDVRFAAFPSHFFDYEV